MRISFELYGGLGGMFTTAPLSYDVDTDGLPPAAADRWHRLVEESGLLQAPVPVAPPEPAARDVLQYRVGIAAGGREYRYEFDDTNVPARARPLLDQLTEAARTRRLGGDAGI